MRNDVKVIFTSALIDLTNSEKEIFVEASSVGEVLEKLVSKYGDDFKNRIFESEKILRRYINVYVNSKDIRLLEGLETSVEARDEITLLPAVGGGSPHGHSGEMTERDKVRNN